MARAPGRLRIVATFALLTLIWGTTWAAIRVSLEGFAPFTGVAIRFAVAAALLLIYMRMTGVGFARTANERRVWFSNMVLSFCGSYGVVYWCEQYVPSGLTSILFATFLGARFLAEGQVRQRLAAAALMVAGLAALALG